MFPQQVADLPSMYLVALIGLILGGLASYIANLILYTEGLITYSNDSTRCSHRGRIIEAIPLISWFLVKGNCKYCQNRVKWQYPLAEILLAAAFVVLYKNFGCSVYALGMATFVTVLLTICVTDFRTKIIPHEITYPAILLGIVFSIIIKADILGALAGIGISYILFDFVAFYGLKIYIWMNQPTLAATTQFISRENSMPIRAKGSRIGKTTWLSQDPAIESSSQKQGNAPKLYCKGLPLEELEVLGGGDAVLSALISAWLGWQKLIFALVMGFIIGTAMGAIYVLIELWKERLLKTVIRPTLLCVAALSALAAVMLGMIASSSNEPISRMQYFYILPIAGLVGFFLGVIIAGSKISKPFPFGPALAAGGFLAIFRDN